MNEGMAGYAEVFVAFLAPDQGGRQTPICLGEEAIGRYRPHLRVHDGDQVYLGVEFVDGPDGPLPPGGRSHATVRFLFEPHVSYEALVVGAEFDICEGDRVVGSGRVTHR